MTFSIVARCERTGSIGVALATGLPAGGAHCLYAIGEVGAVATQAYPNPYLGVDAMQRLRDGAAPGEALTEALAGDLDPARRQVIVVDRDGRTAGHTGSQTFSWRGHRCDEGVAVAANMVPSERVIEAMLEAFESHVAEELWWRLSRALAAGEAAERARLRPCRSAAVRVVATEEYPLFEARIDASANPIADLQSVMGEVEELGLPFTRMLPTRAAPAGRFDLAELEARGLMPDEPWETG